MLGLGLALAPVLTLLQQHADRPDAAGATSRPLPSAPVPTPAPLVVEDSPARISEGSWGHIEFTRVRLVPPEENLELEPCPTMQPGWLFAGDTPDSMEQLYEAAGLTRAQRAEARSSTTCTADRGCWLAPTPAFVGRLGTAARGEIYRRLAIDGRNYLQYYSYRFHADEIDSWFERSDMSPATQAQMRALFYQQTDGLWSFADLPYMCAVAQDRGEQRTILRALNSQTSLVGRLRVPAGTELNPLVHYWSGGRPESPGVRTALASSIGDTREGGGLDLTALLPPLGRLNTYPTQTDKRGLNCFWAALNFFAAEPDPRVMDPGPALAVLLRDYEPVPFSQARYGDVLTIERSGELLHAAVYLADGVYFTKNGRTLLRPWVLNRLPEIRELYPAVQDIQERLYRRRPGITSQLDL